MISLHAGVEPSVHELPDGWVSVHWVASHPDVSSAADTASYTAGSAVLMGASTDAEMAALGFGYHPGEDPGFDRWLQNNPYGVDVTNVSYSPTNYMTALLYYKGTPPDANTRESYFETYQSFDTPVLYVGNPDAG